MKLSSKRSCLKVSVFSIFSIFQKYVSVADVQIKKVLQHEEEFFERQSLLFLGISGIVPRHRLRRRGLWLGAGEGQTLARLVNPALKSPTSITSSLISLNSRVEQDLQIALPCFTGFRYLPTNCQVLKQVVILFFLGGLIYLV